MVFIKLRSRPEDEQVSLGVRMSTSHPSLSSSTLKSFPSTPALNIQIHLRCLSSIQPHRPLTFATSGSIFEPAKPVHGHMDNLARGMLGPGLVCSDAQNRVRKVVSLGYFRVHRARQDHDDAVDLRERPDIAFVTVPSLESREELTFTHTLTSERLFAFAQGMRPEDLEVGETYDMRLDSHYAGAMWWCWGGLEDELGGKRLHSFARGFCIVGNEEKPSEEETQNGGWVTGEDISQLIFKLEEGGGRCSVQVVD